MAVPRAWLDAAGEALAGLTEARRTQALAELEAISYDDIALAREAVIEILTRHSSALSDAAAVVSAEMYDVIREDATGEALGALAEGGYSPEATDAAVRGMIQDVVDGKPVEGFIGECLDRVAWEGQRAFAHATVANGKRDPLKPKFARVPSPGCTCAFCLMLGSRGDVYANEYRAGGRGHHYHPNCRCRVVPCFGGKVDIEGYDPDALYAQYREALEGHEKERQYAIRTNRGKDTKGLYMTAGYDYKGALNTLRRTARAVEDPNLVEMSFNFVHKGDLSYENTDRIKPIDGFTDYKIHSDGYSFDRFGIGDPSSMPVSVPELAKWIKNDRGYTGGSIRLIACSAGKYDDGAAQILADLLGVDVLAPVDTLFVDRDGSMVVASCMEDAMRMLDDPASGKGWKLFTPSRRKGEQEG